MGHYRRAYILTVQSWWDFRGKFIFCSYFN